MKQRVTKLPKLAALFAALGMLPVMPVMPASAKTVEQLVGYVGDLNGDMSVSLWDAFIMRDFLQGVPNMEFTVEQGDLNGNGWVDAGDLTMLKRQVLNGEEPQGIYETVEVEDAPELMEAPISALGASLPSTGEPKILMVAVNFPDCKFWEYNVDQQLAEICFGEEKPDDNAYPMESISAFYRRASYGRLNLQGVVEMYDAKYSINDYADDANVLVDEVLRRLTEKGVYNLNDFDSNGDKVLDSIILVLPEKAAEIDRNGDGSSDWWPYTNSYWGHGGVYNGVRAGKFCIGAYDYHEHAGFNSTWIHELGHAMGLPDYYKYQTDGVESIYGMNGNAGWEIMDDALADFSAFSKLMLGWYTEDEVQVYTGGTQNYTLRSSQEAPNCILIPRYAENGFLSEYFIVEYVTPNQNNTFGYYYGERYQMFKNGGIRVLHCLADVGVGLYGVELSWNNYGLHYDTSNRKQRVLRLVNEAEGGDFFQPYNRNRTIDSRISGFRWYDESGYQTVETGLTIKVNELLNGGGEDPNPESSVPETWRANSAEGSVYSITISDS